MVWCTSTHLFHQVAVWVNKMKDARLKSHTPVRFDQSYCNCSPVSQASHSHCVVTQVRQDRIYNECIDKTNKEGKVLQIGEVGKCQKP